MLTLHTPQAKARILQWEWITVGDKICLVLDPEKLVVKVKMHWVPYHGSDGLVCEALLPSGVIRNVTRDTWKCEGFTKAQSTTLFITLDPSSGYCWELCTAAVGSRQDAGSGVC